MTLDADDIEAIAELLAEKLADRDPAVVRYIDVDAAARRLSLSPDWVRRHAAELGGSRMGDGDRGELRFDIREIDRAYAARRLAKERPRPRRRPGPARFGNVTMLPLPAVTAHEAANAG